MNWFYRLGERRLDLTNRTLVMGILNRTPDSFYDGGETFALDDLVRRGEQLSLAGADILDVGGVKAGPGEEVSEAEELDRPSRHSDFSRYLASQCFVRRV